MPQPPPQAKPGLGAKLTAVALGLSGGMPGIEKGIEYYRGVKDKPIADFERQQKQQQEQALTEETMARASSARSEVPLHEAEAAKALNPPKNQPDPKTVDTGDGVYQYNEDSGRYDIRVGSSPRKPGAEEKILGHTVQELKGEMAANPALYPGGYMEGAAGFKNTKAAAMALDKAHADADRAPERPQRALVAVPQPDGSSKVVEAAAGGTIPKGAETISEMGHKNAPNVDEQRRADLANNLTENLDRLEEIVKRRPDLFGPLAGRATSARQWTGTSDPDVAALATIKEQTGMAMVGAHAMRNAQHVEAAANSIVNAYKNQPEALLGPNGSIAAARQSLKTFIDDVQDKSGATQPASAAGTETKSYNGFEYTKGSDGQWHKGKPLQ